MKKFIFIIFISIISIVSLSAQSSTIIKWEENSSYALQLAKLRNQPLFLLFMSEPADTLSNFVLNNVLANTTLVETINKNFIPLLIRGDKILQEQYKVNRFPTIMTVNKNGVEMDRINNVIESSSTFSLLDSSMKNHKNLNSISGGINSANGFIDANNTTYTYLTDKGTFTKIDDKNWEYTTFLLTIKFKQFSDDNTFHYYIKSEGITPEVNVAIPRKLNSSIWKWDVDKNGWVSGPRITEIKSANSQ